MPIRLVWAQLAKLWAHSFLWLLHGHQAVLLLLWLVVGLSAATAAVWLLVGGLCVSLSCRALRSFCAAVQASTGPSIYRPFAQ